MRTLLGAFLLFLTCITLIPGIVIVIESFKPRERIHEDDGVTVVAMVMGLFMIILGVFFGILLMHV